MNNKLAQKITIVTVATLFVAYIITYLGYLFSVRFAFIIYSRDHEHLRDSNYLMTENRQTFNGYQWVKYKMYDPSYPEILRYMTYGILLYLLFIVVFILLMILILQIMKNKDNYNK